MKRQYLVLDLETMLDTSQPPPPKKKNGGDGCPAAPYPKIAVMGVALLDAFYRLRNIWIVGERHDEFFALASLLAFLNAKLAAGVEVTMVSWNGRGFDLPVIVARCLRHGLAWPWYYATEARRRYGGAAHLDLMDSLVDYGAGHRYGLDIAAKRIGMPGKLDCKGSSVQAMIDAGQIEQVRAYCMQDIAQTCALLLRTQLLRGELAPPSYMQAAEHLLAAVERHRRLAPMAPLLDRDRLLLTGGAGELVPTERAA